MNIKFNDGDKSVHIEGHVYAADVDRLMRLLREFFAAQTAAKPCGRYRSCHGPFWACDRCGAAWAASDEARWRPARCPDKAGNKSNSNNADYGVDHWMK